MTHDPPLPTPFVERFAPLAEVKFSGPRSSFHRCFGCGPDHDIGLRVRTFKAEGEVLSPIVIPGRFEGPPGAAHGGIVAAYLDEI
ncbi:MAG TPA: PaaI family thioesterase, partial [Methylomirabilota bacterium]|nr:PaaI family thioesterase [Methylomirabilota bacterium]